MSRHVINFFFRASFRISTHSHFVQTHIYTRKTTYLHLSTLYWGGGGDYTQIVPLKITTCIGDFLDGFYKCPNYF